MYEYIKNPKNNKKVKVTSKLGKSILKKYFDKLYGGTEPSPEREVTLSCCFQPTDVRYYDTQIDGMRMLEVNESELGIDRRHISNIHHDGFGPNVHYLTLNNENRDLCKMLRTIEKDVMEIVNKCYLDKGKLQLEELGKYTAPTLWFLLQKKDDKITIDILDKEFELSKGTFKDIFRTDYLENITDCEAIYERYLSKYFFASQSFLWNLARTAAYAIKYLSKYREQRDVKLIISTDINGSVTHRARAPYWHADGWATGQPNPYLGSYQQHTTLGTPQGHLVFTQYFTKGYEDTDAPVIGPFLRTQSNPLYDIVSRSDEFTDPSTLPPLAHPLDKNPFDGSLGCERMVIIDNTAVLHRSQTVAEIEQILKANSKNLKEGGMIRYNVTVY